MTPQNAWFFGSFSPHFGISCGLLSPVFQEFKIIYANGMKFEWNHSEGGNESEFPCIHTHHPLGKRGLRRLWDSDSLNFQNFEWNS